MRSGQYKLTCSKSSGAEEGKGISGGHFRSCQELPSLSIHNQNDLEKEQLQTDFNALNFAGFRRNDRRVDGGKDAMIKSCKEQLMKGERRAEGILRHRSCENVSLLSRGAVNRVEQKVRSLLLRGDSKKRSTSVFHLYNQADFFEPSSKADIWQAGKIVTMHKKQPRISAAHSHSALHTLSTSSDTASCLSASSGYSSSSSSSYGSFKSSGSVCSTLPRHRNNSSGSQSPSSENNRILFADNPLYDVIPGTAMGFNDVSRYCDPPMTGLDSLSSLEYGLGEGLNPISDPFNDPIAKQCREYFEKRLQSSETLRRKWSLYISQPKMSEPDRVVDSELISKGDAIIDSKFNAGFGSEMNFCVEPNFIPSSEDAGLPVCAKKKKKNVVDEKMELLRQEIATLIQQDDTLFRQLLSLSDSISSLKVQNALSHAHILGSAHSHALSSAHSHALGSAHTYAHRPLTPSDLDSFTEEEEDEDEDEEEEEEGEREREMEREEEEERRGCGEEEGLRTHILAERSVEGPSVLALHSNPEETQVRDGRHTFSGLHGNGMRSDQLVSGHMSGQMMSGQVMSGQVTSSQLTPTQLISSQLTPGGQLTSGHHEDDLKDVSVPEEDEEDEGHCTDLSTGHTPSHSPSPASTLSSNSSKGSSYSRSLYSEMTSDFSGSFTRCRKSYAPNARNRRRASSVHRQKSPHLDCGTTTALVLVHADDELALLHNASRPRAHSFTPLTVFAAHDALSYTQANDANKALYHNNKNNKINNNNNLDGNPCLGCPVPPSRSKERDASEGRKRAHSKVSLNASCSSQTSVSSSLCTSSRPNLAHPPYREALIM